MNTKLDNITTQYRKFNVNQALTEGQLNEFIDYFEDQDRLSRTRLNGVGVGCGFETGFMANTAARIAVVNPDQQQYQQQFQFITISQGVGVTTDGDLITLRKNIPGSKSKEVKIDDAETKYAYYRAYLDPYKYPHFYSGNTQMPLLELFTQTDYEDLIAKGAIADSFRPVSALQQEVRNKIVILYLESYSNEESPCQDVDCDNNGAEQVSDLKVLLANRSDMDFYALNSNGYDSIYQQYNNYELLYEQLRNVEVPRVILDRNVTTELALRTKFQNAIQSGTLITDLDFSFNLIADMFDITMDFGGLNLRDKLDQALNTASYDYQYRYDLLKDLVDTYNEIKGLVLHLKSECCPDINAFQKHLLLGPLGAPLNQGDHTSYRHDFYSAPINTHEDENKEKLISLANRFTLKLKKFQSFKGPIVITPSNTGVALSEKAIPFYYNVDLDLLEKWNFEKTKNYKETYNLSYHKANLATDDFIRNPLLYNMDHNDFYKIEGFVGMPYTIAMQNINALRDRYGLAFKVSGLSLEKSTSRALSGTVTTATAATATVATAAAAAAGIAAVVTPGDVTAVPETPVLPVGPELTTISIKDLRAQLVAISSDISNQVNAQQTLRTISGLDNQLKLLNTIDFKAIADSGISIVTQTAKEEKVDTEFLGDFLDLKSGLEHDGGVPFGGTLYLIYRSEEHNTVLADFALPYLCCSKKDPVFMALPTAKLCQNDAKIPFTIIPLDGDIKANIAGREVKVVSKTAGQNFFDPGLVAAADLGKTITFTVNDDPVDAKMIVHALPNVTVTASEPIHGEVPDLPDAEVTFTVTGALANLTYMMDFGDGKKASGTVPLDGKIKNTYKLVAGQEDTFRPTITISNTNSCSKKYDLKPIVITGQTTVKCLSGLEVTIQYHDTKGPCPGGHACNSARFKLLANSIPLGNATNGSNIVNLNNGSAALQPGQAYGDGETSGRSRKWTYSISATEAQAIVAANQPNDGFISFSLVCADSSCHSGVAWTTLKLDGAVIYNGCPKNNFLTINPCTGEIKK
ncbi:MULTISPECIES: hypothetical protein [unclassified Flavobacterium]|uniref:hypothetical protein n=1 Tax=unclassified Flavobacterium TaxID=196869 RepID=UPI00086EE21B|nr:MULTISPECIES: hypothetical protein [unclassified Flavobacterium]MBN9284277.1 hypothetical protein [Flavobacterium sp.]ODS85668.1 MAG: hypothetical protein ABS44_14785 [Chryseobacterium sp. SCN 40-13]OJV73022.1 MAG: hypothetical protein BGO42_00860 [Flavobacterium sp. 40-81]